MIGAGVIGSWIAHTLIKLGNTVALLDAYGAGNSRASSGGESRVIRMGYGDNDLYTRWSQRSMNLWKAFFKSRGLELFHQTGVLWLAWPGETYTLNTRATLERLRVSFERLGKRDLEARFPQIALRRISWGLLEPNSGVLSARRAVQALVDDFSRNGGDYIQEAVLRPTVENRIDRVVTSGGRQIKADVFVFACGPWLPRVFPELLKGVIRPTRQEVFFFGPAPGDQSFAPPRMPVWIELGAGMYGVPDVEGRGFKLAPDKHGPPFDPDSGSRLVTARSVANARRYIAGRFPALKASPLLETRVCQYENTWNGEFLIDRHPRFQNVWLVGGGSGHAFKHGPVLGEYVSAKIVKGGEADSVFRLAAKQRVKRRMIY